MLEYRGSLFGLDYFGFRSRWVDVLGPHVHTSEADIEATQKALAAKADAEIAFDQRRYKDVIKYYNSSKSDVLQDRNFFQLGVACIIQYLIDKKPEYLSLAQQALNQVIGNEETSIYDTGAALLKAISFHLQGKTMRAKMMVAAIQNKNPRIIDRYLGDDRFPLLEELVVSSSKV